MKLNLDITLDKNKYPKDLKYWHDMRIDPYQAQKSLQDKQERQELYKQFETVANKYLSMQRIMDEDFVVIMQKGQQN